MPSCYHGDQSPDAVSSNRLEFLLPSEWLIEWVVQQKFHFKWLVMFNGKGFVNILYYSRETYNALTNWLTDARTLASPNIVIILCGNKKDLDADREVTFLEASRFAQENGNSAFAF